AMFYNSNFNQDISGWDISSSTSIRAMFEYTNFNYDIGDWDTSNIIDMDYIFNEAVNFNQDLTGWCVTNILSEPPKFATSSALSSVNKPVWGTCPGD
ncbi:MAG: BspA family leucine-rich repeat surface protein, partial [Flavobacteriaceae bacterium]|nr:BspA family leucine-rich repeat surface protein [Flavobacteriaceae bacterium]